MMLDAETSNYVVLSKKAAKECTNASTGNEFKASIVSTLVVVYAAKQGVTVGGDAV